MQIASRLIPRRATHRAPSHLRRFVITLLPAAALLGLVPRSAAACVGDCGSDGSVTIEELITMVNVALGTTGVANCGPGDGNGDGGIDVAEIVTAVNNALGGCSSGPPASPTPTPTATSGHTGSYVGQYYGTAGTFALSFRVTANGTASGTLGFLDGPAALTANARASRGQTFAATGTANLTTGAYQLSGNLGAGGPAFSAEGQLPSSLTANGTLTLTVAGAPFQGTLRAGGAPTPTPTPDCNTGNLQASISNPSGGFNGTTSGFVVQRILGASEARSPSYIEGSHEVYNSNFSGVECTQPGQPLRNLQISLYEVPGGLTAGQSFPLSQGGGEGAGGIVYYGEAGPGGDSVWSSSSGTVHIDAVNGSVVSLRIVGAAMTVPAGNAAGSFTLDVNGQVNNFTRQP